jgi:hypothetical protein
VLSEDDEAIEESKVNRRPPKPPRHNREETKTIENYDEFP